MWSPSGSSKALSDWAWLWKVTSHRCFLLRAKSSIPGWITWWPQCGFLVPRDCRCEHLTTHPGLGGCTGGWKQAQCCSPVQILLIQVISSSLSNPLRSSSSHWWSRRCCATAWCVCSLTGHLAFVLSCGDINKLLNSILMQFWGLPSKLKCNVPISLSN